MSFALKNIRGAELRSGAEIVMEITGAEDLIRDCDIVVTGEGRIDSQTLNGKAPFRVLQLAARYGKPVYGITGTLSDEADALTDAGFSKIIPLTDPAMEKDKAQRSVSLTLSRLFEKT